MPPELDDKTADLPPSEQVNDVTEATAAEADGAGAADPSPANDEPKDMLSVVRDVVSPSEEPAPSAEGTAEEDQTAASETDPDAEKQPDDTNYSDVPFNKHPRFQQLLRKSKENEADAQQYRVVQSFLKENNLTPDQAAEGLQIMALIGSDPSRALEMLKPHIQRLLESTGETLPADLRQRVQAGELPLDAAKEISKARAGQHHTLERQRADEQRRQEEAAHQQALLRQQTAQAWLQDRMARDPAFQSKEPLMQREVALLQRQEGIPPTPEGVRDQLQRAYAEVNKQARVVAPAPAPKPAVRPVTGGTAPGTPAPEPKSMLDAMRMGSGAK